MEPIGSRRDERPPYHGHALRQGRPQVVRVRFTVEGDCILQTLTRAHLERLHDLATVLDALVVRTAGPTSQLAG
jgi:hypothetical protein